MDACRRRTPFSVALAQRLAGGASLCWPSERDELRRRPCLMSITPDTLVADIATATPATIAVFQRHHIDFCCGGRIPLRDACQAQGLDPSSLLDELAQAAVPAADGTNWHTAELSALIDHIQARYHEPLRDELPRLRAMLATVVSRHGEHHAG